MTKVVQLVMVVLVAFFVFGPAATATAKRTPKPEQQTQKPYYVLRADGTVQGYDTYTSAEFAAIMCNLERAGSCTAWEKREGKRPKKIKLGEKVVQDDGGALYRPLFSIFIISVHRSRSAVQ